MSNPRIIFPFTRLPDISFSKKAQIILDAMDGNPFFPDPSPTISELKAAIDLFIAAIAGSKHPGRQSKRAEISNMRIALEEMLVKLAVYVMQVASGNRTILMSSGFDLSD